MPQHSETPQTRRPDDSNDRFIIYNDHAVGCLYTETVWIGRKAYPLHTEEERQETIRRIKLLGTAFPDVAMSAAALVVVISNGQKTLDRAKSILLDEPQVPKHPPKRAAGRFCPLCTTLHSFFRRSLLRGRFWKP